MRRKHGRNDQGGQLMECLELDSSHFFVDSDAIDSPLDIHLEFNSLTVAKAVPDHSRYSQSGCSNVPDPPPLPGTSYGAQRSSRNAKACSRVLEEVLDSGDKLFQEGYQADLRVLADGGSEILSHSCVLGVKSPVLRAMLEEAKLKHGLPCIRIPGAPSEAVRVFIRFLYSSRLCDAPRLSVICTRMIVADFKTISLSDGWKVMRQANPSLEQELLESLVEADTKRQERAERIEENKVYLQLYEAMEALVHICRDGCRTIGPRDQALKGSGAAVCKFPACRGIELLVRHFSACRVRVPGGCGNCKRMWQLLELHSRMCFTPDTCKVPLCRHFKEKMQHLGRKEETKWNLLACKVLESRGTMSSISERRNLSTVKPTDSCRMVPI
ncbi:BTB/POZ and TAZ domain-containing protein 3 isoform X5 [Phragmites australis]|uniref:BTB/POZ and TAZ domain-containing protein 3 isoform X5 n=1 Tax=Phragmites australis TaxID=29695 RepID=UPI002D786F2F|nr:BTB/POZ and TAZ domain-containing protein 3 isoform X5 [Phragmites australis]